MKKVLFVILILLLSTAIWANPPKGARGVVTYSETINVYFDSEANALQWIQTQADFMAHRETNEAQRRLMTMGMEIIMPDFALITRLESDFLVMVTRTSAPGESSLMFFSRGVMTRLWQY